MNSFKGIIKSGLVSITFRELNPLEIIRLVSKAGLDGIEWGGDVHVPHGDIKKNLRSSQINIRQNKGQVNYKLFIKVATLKELLLSFPGQVGL